MSKILDSEFRKGLYKSLTDAGYDKNEAQKIVGKKYYEVLHEKVLQGLNEFEVSVVQEKFDVTFAANEFNEMVAELKKLKEILG